MDYFDAKMIEAKNRVDREELTLREEIGGIIYDADVYKNKVTTGQLDVIVDDIIKEIGKRINAAKSLEELKKSIT